jgi:hypothetical protein
VGVPVAKEILVCVISVREDDMNSHCFSLQFVYYIPFIISLAFSISVSGITRYVNVNNPTPAAPYTNWHTAATIIQDAVDAAVDGDLVLVTNGVYDSGGDIISGRICSNRVIVTKNIMVKSMNGPQETRILGMPDPVTGGYGTNGVSGVYMGAGILCGFTVSNSGGCGVVCSRQVTNCIISGNYGQGVYLKTGTVNNCIITGNSNSWGWGGGVAMSLDYYVGKPRQINNCIISGNKAVYTGPHWVNASGGGVWGQLFVMYNCIISGNSAEYGGGVYFGGGSRVTNCTIFNNVATRSGGGVYGLGALDNCIIYSNSADIGGGIFMRKSMSVSEPSVSNCMIYDNQADAGGGIYCDDGGQIYNNIISNNNGGGIYFNEEGIGYNNIINRNHAGSGGGVLFSDAGSLYNCMISDNISEYGGGVYFGTSGTVYNCLISDNISEYGGGVYFRYGGTVYNCTICNNNSSRTGGGVYCKFGGNLVNTIIYFNTSPDGTNWFNYSTGMSYTCCCALPVPDGLANIHDNPEFVDMNAGNYRLDDMSPCRDAGTNLAWMIGATDLDGNPRILPIGGQVDMGAYEFIPEPAGILIFSLGITLWCIILSKE